MGVDGVRLQQEMASRMKAMFITHHCNKKERVVIQTAREFMVCKKWSDRIGRRRSRPWSRSPTANRCQANPCMPGWHHGALQTRSRRRKSVGRKTDIRAPRRACIRRRRAL